RKVSGAMASCSCRWRSSGSSSSIPSATRSTSASSWGILGKEHSVGFANYHGLWQDNTFHIAIKNTLEYTVGVVPLEMALGLSVALIVNAKIRAKTFFRAAFYFPSLASSVAITTIAVFILSANGLFNHIFGGHRSWFTDEHTVLWSIVGLNAWTTSG